MTAILSHKFKTTVSQLFLNDFGNTETNYYFFIGRPLPWDNEETPDTFTDARLDRVRIWDQILALKKVPLSNVSFVIPRHNWDTSGKTIYAPYRDNDPNIFVHPTAEEIQAASIDGTYTAGSHYVLTNEWNVYKCIDNNGNSKSTAKPTGTGLSVIETIDGYKWKFLYTISDSERTKFLTPDWMPVKTLTEDDGSAQWDVQNSAVNGGIESILLTASGANYQSLSGTVASATNSTITLDSGASQQDDAYNGATIFISGPTGGGQARVISDYDGTTRTATVAENWGMNPDSSDTFEILPTVNITGNGTGAIAKVSLNSGAIESVSMVDPGQGYTYAVATIPNVLGGSGAAAIPQISPSGGHGFDPVDGLGARHVMITSRLDFDETDFPQASEYRTVGIVRGVLDHGTNDISDSDTLTNNSVLEITLDSGNFIVEEIIESSGGAKAIIVEGSSTEIRYIQTPETGYEDFTATETITGLISGAVATVDAIQNPDVERYSGEILFIQNRKKVTRDEDQIEDIKIVIGL